MKKKKNAENAGKLFEPAVATKPFALATTTSVELVTSQAWNTFKNSLLWPTRLLVTFERC